MLQARSISLASRRARVDARCGHVRWQQKHFCVRVMNSAFRPATPEQPKLEEPQPATSTPVVDGSTTPATAAAAQQYGWSFDSKPSSGGRSVRARLIKDLPVAAIRRPLGRTRSNDQAKVEALMASIQEIGLQEPIDVLEVDGIYYGFSGCHRYEAHQRLGLETIRCRVRKATQEVLKMHLM